ncbi:polyketide cyclase [Luteimonas yindakuii]|uniref:SRPBCC family protein n=1 Tax=Luteimonas yindakuii TaxID=2565782 RepID=UPI001107A3BF|nr:SRPBCC family protein [Luteimonas yindakuii]QCU72640.1 polyketide cyclase [Luteimonas yindakuii]
MTRLLEILIALAITAVMFLVIGVLLPSSRSLEEKVETNRRQTIVFDTINSFRRFDDWHPFAAQDPRIKIQLSGPDSGVGAKMSYDSSVKNIGTGTWEIVESEPRSKVAYAIENEQRGSNKRSEFTLRPTGRSGRNIEITQTYNVDYGWDLLGRYAGLYVARNVGDNIETGLKRLSNMLASVPNVDYAIEGSSLRDLAATELPAEHLLMVKAGAIERSNDAIMASMKDNMEWINRTLAANRLQAAGPMRIITSELGRETYTFDIAVPVRAGGAAAAADASAEGETAAAAPAATDASQPLTGLQLLGPVEYVHSPPVRVAKARYTGFMAELDNVRNALRAWAMTQGHEVVGRPFENYDNGIDAAFTAEGEYEVFWTLKQ